MSYHIYTTKGIVLSERPVREADRLYKILTRDLGLIQARALGVRNGLSKIRGHIEPVSLASISLVRGKEYWRITSAESIRSILPSPYVIRPLTLLEKLVQGEISHPELFDTVENAILPENFDNEYPEINLVSKILFHLGYLREEDLTSDRKDMIRAINHGIEKSHLVEML